MNRLGLKRHNPGCNCCGDVLVWDLGVQSGGWDGTYTFQNWTNLAEFFESIDVSVDFVTGASDQEDSFFLDNPDFDPYTTAVEDENWSGNIFDYKLIYWPYPAADEDLTAGHYCSQDANDVAWHQPGVANHEFFGGVPDWWESIATGAWKGRVVWVTEGNAGNSFLVATRGLAVNLFLNSLSDVHGLELDETHYQWPFGPNPNLQTIWDVDLTEGVNDFPPIIYPATRIMFAGGVSGAARFDELADGTDQFLDISVEWCEKDFEDEETLELIGTVAARSTIGKPQGADQETVIPVDFVIFQHQIMRSITFEDSESFGQLHRNLFEVPVQLEDSVQSG